MALNVGIIGTGNIAPKYIYGCGKFPDDIQVVACADLIMERAEAFAGEYGLTAYTVDELLAQDEIDIVLNLTIPRAHREVSVNIAQAGKHVYSEKPLGLTREEGLAILAAAKENGVRVGCAPDTFLGGGGQTARSLIEAGAIGKPIAATAFMMVHGHESWHPNPFFYYDLGGGPMLDMGPYYLTALVNLMGPMKRVSGSVGRAFDERTAQHEDVRGQKIPVKVDTHIAGTIDFANGAIATVAHSFDVWQHNLSRIEIHGTEGSLVVPDPNRFDGEVMVWQSSSPAWENIPLRFRSDIERGAGVADMARCIQSDVPHRATGEMAYHVLDAMLSFVESSDEGKHVILESTTQQPAPVDGTFQVG